MTISGAGRFKAYVVAMFAVAATAFIHLPISADAAGKNKTTEEKHVNPLDMPMIFSIVRSAAGYCEPNCPEWIYGEGQIVAATPAAFKKVLKRAGDRKLPLLIVSPGGNVTAAMEMGRIIRKRGINVEVSATRFFACNPRDQSCKPDGAQQGEYKGLAYSAGAFCWSACPLVLAGGERRISSQWSHTGVHQITTVYARERVYFREKYRIVNGKKKVISRKVLKRKNAGTQSSTRLPKSTRKALLAYFRDMGVERSILDAMLSTPPDRIRRLEPKEMLDLHLITEITSSDLLANPDACAGRDAPANCVMRNPEPLTEIMPQGAPGNPT